MGSLSEQRDEKVKSSIAHVRKSDGEKQELRDHLTEVSAICQTLAAKLGLPSAGLLIGLLHDFGKFSQQFQIYIQSATGVINPDEDDYVDAKGLKGKIDHSTAGAQWVYQQLKPFGAKGQGELCGQILAVCIASHHSGLIDCLSPDGENSFKKRMGKFDEKSHLKECIEKSDKEILEQAADLAKVTLIEEMFVVINHILKASHDDQPLSVRIREFYLGFYARFLFSCLIDADRINSIDFETPENTRLRSSALPAWNVAISRLETKLATLKGELDIDVIRRKISDTCLNRAQDKQGIYTLTVPTGGGKTLASLRFALQHAKKHDLERIIYIIPYTSIIEQNADAVRKIVEDAADIRPWVLEHHSNLEPEQQTWHSKLASENWDSPIIFTTMVQFLEVLFSGGTRSVRRLHQLANSVLIFDEIQTLPINCVHLYCNAINFLTEYAKTTTVLCTATQPLLNKLPKSDNGQLHFLSGNEIITEVAQLFDDLERVNVENLCKPQGWSGEEIANLAMDAFEQKGSCLIIVNTKNWAQQLYQSFEDKGLEKDALFHLSTNQCAAHRKNILDVVKKRLANKLPVMCVSTQLIEAGVDVSFATVIRFLAGLDSIAQAAGRCNRHGELKDNQGVPIKGSVYVLNPDKESTGLLKEIEIGKDKARRVFDDLGQSSVLTPESISTYFNYYFFDRADDMTYPLKDEIGSTDTLLNLLSQNGKNSYTPKNLERASEGLRPLLMQSFKTAANQFKAIEAPTRSVIVPYGEGKELIAELCKVSKDFNAKKYYGLLKQAQKFSVNVFPNVWRNLEKAEAIVEIQKEGIYFLKETNYSQAFGLSAEVVADMDFMGV
ncbi:MAG: CRISPR-associated helicase/endonuclease Cas3 [Betaproteobacteria bacterium HGW-Betaproteobacteria-22]|nr:MAG: CRISPR-associated helicase/endonuclease Cas3 [Betaproteobacteria bacterium HGW-Betaproteobacteria-22]